MSLSTDNTSVPLPPPFNTIPRIPLLYSFPSPIEPLPRLSQHLSTQNTTAPHDTPASGSRTVELYIKRDDTSSGLSGGGGNKLRKLEYVLADAVKVGAEMIVTEGGVQSNHMRQTVAAGNRVGLKVSVVLVY
jgi:1-aminocyclopropane-1-carboxylate deaminase